MCIDYINLLLKPHMITLHNCLVLLLISVVISRALLYAETNRVQKNKQADISSTCVLNKGDTTRKT
jgi:hypothetical protein